MRQLGFVLLVLAGCGTTTRGPAWPKSSPSSEDGGESLAPRPSAHELAAPELSETPVDSPEPAATTTSASKPEAAPATSTSATAPAADDPATVEEMTIEIDDD